MNENAEYLNVTLCRVNEEPCWKGEGFNPHPRALRSAASKIKTSSGTVKPVLLVFFFFFEYHFVERK